MSAETQADTQTHIEAELKLLLADENGIDALLDAIRARAQLGSLVPTEHEDIYYDTPEGDLRKAGLGARVRRGKKPPSLMIKPVLLAPQAVLVRPELGRTLVDGEPDGPALRAFLAAELGVDLDADPEPVLLLKSARRKGVIEHAAFRAEICDDHVELALPDGSRTARLHEVELELLEGDLDALSAMVKELVQELDLQPSTLGKYVRARDLLGLPPFRYGVGKTELTADVEAQTLIRARLLRQLAKIRAHAPGTAVALDPEQLHDMRVASRRLRSGLRVFRKNLDKDARKALGNELKQLGRTLGELRDLDVHLENAVRDRQTIGAEATDALLARLRARRGPVVQKVRAALGSTAFEALLEKAEWVIGSPPPAAAPGGTAGALAARVLRREAKRYARQIEALADVPTADDLHDVRIAGKRLRYAIEFVSPVLGDEAADAIQRLRLAQDELGAFQDDVALLAQADHEGADAATANALAAVASRIGDPAAYLRGVLERLDAPGLRKDLKRLAKALMPPPAAEPASEAAEATEPPTPDPA
ncbi:MAG: CHAD domain-containing protein [Planctomycetota bacterium]|nr:CHAD domain-containing protein [Planctomycetota bacterium]